MGDECVSCSVNFFGDAMLTFLSVISGVIANTKADGSTQQMDDVWFSVDTARTVNLNTVTVTVTVSDEIAALPELLGMGNVASLRQAMAQESGWRKFACV